MDGRELDRAFRDWTVAHARDDQLLEMLRYLCTAGAPEEKVRHRELLRGITINHIQMSRTINDLKSTLQALNKANERTQRLLMRLTIAAFLVGFVQAAAAVVSVWLALRVR
jgi:hypothetical protein